MMSKFNGKKTNNAKTDAKIKLRKKALTLSRINILEVFCGAGEMYNSVWSDADKYTGIDIVKYFDKRNTICGDAFKAVSSIDLTGFNVFDIDAYGSPYLILDKVIERIDKTINEFYFIITDGSAMDLRLGRICHGMRRMTNIDFHVAKRAASIHEDLIKEVIKNIEERLNGVMSEFSIARGKTGAAMRYYAFKITVN